VDDLLNRPIKQPEPFAILLQPVKRANCGLAAYDVDAIYVPARV